jgi:hypothetical protein
MTISVLIVEDEPVFLLFRLSPVDIADAPVPRAEDRPAAPLLSSCETEALRICQKLAVYSRGEAVHEANQLGLQ